MHVRPTRTRPDIGANRRESADRVPKWDVGIQSAWEGSDEPRGRDPCIGAVSMGNPRRDTSQSSGLRPGFRPGRSLSRRPHVLGSDHRALAAMESIRLDSLGSPKPAVARRRAGNDRVAGLRVGRPRHGRHRHLDALDSSEDDMAVVLGGGVRPPGRGGVGHLVGASDPRRTVRGERHAGPRLGRCPPAAEGARPPAELCTAATTSIVAAAAVVVTQASSPTEPIVLFSFSITLFALLWHFLKSGTARDAWRKLWPT